MLVVAAWNSITNSLPLFSGKVLVQTECLEAIVSSGAEVVLLDNDILLYSYDRLLVPAPESEHERYVC